MTKNPATDIDITYNIIDLPKKVRGGANIDYIYTYGGEKIRQVKLADSTSLEETRTYIAGMEFVNDTLESIQHSDGRLLMVQGDTMPHYQYRIADHLGNTVVFFEDKDGDGLILDTANDSSEVLMKKLYYPFGMDLDGVMPQVTAPLNRYLYNGKEKIAGVGLYDYGARMYDPAIARWTSVDALAEKYVAISPYTYVANMPIVAIDPDGQRIIFVNGYLGFGSPIGGAAYWNGKNSNFVKGAKKFYGDQDAVFTNVVHGKFSSVKSRMSAGKNWAKANYKMLTKGLDKNKDDFKIVTHSMGAAFGEGAIEYLKGEGWNVTQVAHFEAYQADGVEANTDPPGFGTDENTTIGTTTIDYQLKNDPVLNQPLNNSGDIEGDVIKIRETGKSDLSYRHREPIDRGNIWKRMEKLVTNFFNQKK